jgi:quercetin dioxygenase-like cupin family protein
MQQAEFEAELKSQGYTEIESKSLDTRPVNHGHTHDYDIRGLVLSGVFIVNQGDAPVTYRASEIFDVPAGSSHTEEIGAEGANILVGRKY